MKQEEKKGYEYLKSLGYQDIIFEPDGKKPPDFLVNQELAIEVRRLNQHKILSHKEIPEPLEELEFKLIPKFKKLLEKYDKTDAQTSSFVIIDFSRPLNPNKKLMSEIDRVLNSHLILIDKAKKYVINKYLTLEFIPLHKRAPKTYIHGVIDGDTGGMIVQNVYKGLVLAIEDKVKKVTPYFKKYPHWWLILVDYISPGLEKTDIDQLKELFDVSHIFERVIIITPESPKTGIIL